MKLLTLAAAALLAGALPAKAEHHGNHPTLVGAAVASPDHETLVAAVKAADLAGTLSGNGPFTVFAPTDAAFAALPAGTVETLLKPENKATLQSILTYHVVAGAVSATDLIGLIQDNGGSVAVTTVQGGTLTASIADGSVMLTDAAGRTARVVATDLKASNGLIHVTDAVSLPS